MELKAVLIDLDNTLILFEETTFFKAYMKEISTHFSDLMDPQQFTQRLLYSTQMMVNNNGEQTNAEFFMDAFANGITIDKNELWHCFELFYANEFEQFQPLMSPLKGAPTVLNSIQQKGLKIVIATNPMFPMNVQLTRLRWAGFTDFKFDYVVFNIKFKAVIKSFTFFYQINNLNFEKYSSIFNSPVRSFAKKYGIDWTFYN